MEEKNCRCEDTVAGPFICEEHSGTGKKNDKGKPPIALIPGEAIWEEAKVMGFGEKKYSKYNWMQGLGMVRLLSAAGRHIVQFTMGQDNDEETGLSHLAHARCCLGMAIWTMQHRRDLDDRYTRPPETHC